MPSKLTFLKIFLLSLLFTGALFGFQMYVSLNFSDTLAEENYIEKSLHNHKEIVSPTIEGQTQLQENIDNIQPEANSAPNAPSINQQDTRVISHQEARQIYFSYIPTNLRSSVREYRDITRQYINGETFGDKIKELTVEFHEEMVDVRGRMKNKTIKIFDPLQMGSSEFLALFTHEFAHYIDLYFFSRTPFGDISEDFYDISWQSTKTMKGGQNTTDFVSGYAMTNKYEDFAETLTYYMFHNADFQEKLQSSTILAGKYEFLQNNLFDNNAFVGTDFSLGNEVKSYYWDITKIKLDSENFLQYLQKDI